MIENASTGRPDPLGDYADAFQLGRRMAARPQPAAPPAEPTDPRALLAGLPEAHQHEAARRLQIIAGIARAIATATPDPLERARLAQHFAQMHPELGINPEQLTPDTMTDQNLAAIQSLASGGRGDPPPSDATHAGQGFTILGVE